MAKSIFSDSLMRSLKSSKDKAAIELKLNDKMQRTLRKDFDVFLSRVFKKIQKLQHYVTVENNIDPYMYIELRTVNFEFKYTIKSDNSSKFEINKLERYSKEFDSSFLNNKVNINIKKGFVYFLNSEFGIKIGCTGNLNNRLNIFAVRLPFPTTLHSFVNCIDYYKLEQLLHTLLHHKRINGEWFLLDDEDFKEIDKLLLNMKLKRAYDFNLVADTNTQNEQAKLFS